jgi:hypothetical protein
MSEVREFAVEHNPRGCSEPSTRVHIRGGTCAQMLEFSPAVVQRGSRLASTVRPLTTLCGGHVTRTDTVVPSPIPAVRRARPRGSARGRGASGIETRGRARRSPGRPARASARDPTALANTRPTRRRVRADPPAGSAGAHADTREHTVHQGASKAARAAASWSGGRPPGPGPRGNQCLVRAGPRSAPRRGHARGPRPLASETKKRRKTSYRKTSERNRKTAIPACP